MLVWRMIIEVPVWCVSTAECSSVALCHIHLCLLFLPTIMDLVLQG